MYGTISCVVKQKLQTCENSPFFGTPCMYVYLFMIW